MQHALDDYVGPGGQRFSEREISEVTDIMFGHKKYERMFFIVAAWKEGRTLEEIGNLFGISRERIRQVLVMANLLGLETKGRATGGRVRSKIVREQEIRAKVREREEARLRRHFGCSPEEFYKLNEGKSPWGKSRGRAYVYFHQRRSMLHWGNEWKLNFPEWCKVWDESGEWHRRGRGIGAVCLARIDSNKPFELGNVAIMRCEDVSSGAGKAGWARNAHPFKPGDTQMIRTLIHKQDEILRLREEDGLSLREAAEKMGVTTNTASGYCSAARRRKRNDAATVPATAPAPSFAERLGGLLRRGKQRS